MGEIQPQKAVYYPHLVFASPAWVKSALLYWDGIVRLVGEVMPEDDPEIRQLAEAGLIENAGIPPVSPAVVAAFGARLEDLLREGRELRKAIPAARGLRGRRPDLVAHRVDEIERLLDEQGRSSAAQLMRELPEQSLTLYATVVVQDYAEKRVLAAVTDDSIFSAAHMYLNQAGIKRDPATMHGAVAAADLLFPRPAQQAVESVSVPQLLELRTRLAKQRRAFRDKVEGQLSAIARLPTPQAVRDHISSFASSIQEDIEEQREALKTARVKEAWQLMSLATSAAAAVGSMIASAAAPLLSPVAGAGAVALEVTNWFVQRRRKTAPTPNYMLSLEKALGREGRGLEAGLDQLIGH
jgi:hypothetical protein